MIARAATIIALAAAAGCAPARAPAPQADVSVATLRTVADRFDRAQIAKDGPALQALVADELVFIEGDGARRGKAAFIAGWTDPATTFAPIAIADRTFVPLGPDAGVVGGDVVLRGRSGGVPFASRIRFSDTFRRIDGAWRATYIQVTRIATP